MSTQRCCIGWLVLACACDTNPRSFAVDEAPLALTAATRMTLVTSSPPVVEAIIDGNLRVRLLVDTGASVTLLGHEPTQRLGLVDHPYSAAGNSTTSDSRSVSFDSYVHVERLAIGSLELADARITVIDSEAFVQVGIDGILGQDLMSRLVVVFDAERGGLHLLPPGTTPNGIQSYLRDQELGVGAWGRVPVEFRPIPFLHLEWTAGSTIDLALDTGATRTSLPTHAIEAIGLEPIGSEQPRSLAGETLARTFLLERLNLFGLQIRAEVAESELSYGLLGMDIISQLVVVIDGPGRELWLHRRAASTAGAEAAQPDEH